jgi:hypothetical protein
VYYTRLRYKINNNLFIEAENKMKLSGSRYVVDTANLYLVNTSTQAYTNLTVKIGNDTVFTGSIKENSVELIASSLLLGTTTQLRITNDNDINFFIQQFWNNTGDSVGSRVTFNAFSFTDEDSPAIQYTAYSSNNTTATCGFRGVNGVDFVIKREDVPYSSTLATYILELTEAERELLRGIYNKAVTNNIAFVFRQKRGIAGYKYYDYNVSSSLQSASVEYYQEEVNNVAFTIINCAPTLAPTVKDVNARTVYLTGNNKKFIKYTSIAEFNTGAAAHKKATIVNQSVINGTHTVENLSSGTIEEVDSNTFYFAVTDSRNITTRDFIVVDLVPYVKLTSSITSIHLNTDGELNLEVTGNYYNGSFGAVNNSLEVEYGIRENKGDIEWHIIQPTISFDENTYTLNYTITGLDYRNTYTVTVNVIDEIMNAQTDEKVLSSIPVFDWGQSDFKHHTNVYLDNNKTLRSYTAEGDDIQILGVNGSNGTVLGWGGYDTEKGATGIYGNNVNITAKKKVNINGREYAANKVLWSGAYYMNGSQTITLNEAISKQTNGIVLVFSLFRNGAAEDVSINTAFVSKKEVELLNGAPHTFLMAINAGFSNIGAKYLVINDTTISGNDTNVSSGTNSGITFNNGSYVLRYVIGV